MALVYLQYELRVVDGGGIHQEQTQRSVFLPGVLPNGKREPVTVAGASFTALSPPAGAKGVALILGGASGLTLKGVTGDFGISLAPAANPITGFDLIMPLGATPSLGLASSNAAGQVIEVIWF